MTHIAFESRLHAVEGKAIFATITKKNGLQLGVWSCIMHLVQELNVSTVTNFGCLTSGPYFFSVPFPISHRRLRE